MTTLFNYVPTSSVTSLTVNGEAQILPKYYYQRAGTIYNDKCIGGYENIIEGEQVARKNNWERYVQGIYECLELYKQGKDYSADSFYTADSNKQQYIKLYIDLCTYRYYDLILAIFRDKELSQCESFQELKAEYIDNNKLIVELRNLMQNASTDSLKADAKKLLVSNQSLLANDAIFETELMDSKQHYLTLG